MIQSKLVNYQFTELMRGSSEQPNVEEQTYGLSSWTPLPEGANLVTNSQPTNMIAVATTVITARGTLLPSAMTLTHSGLTPYASDNVVWWM